MKKLPLAVIFIGLLLWTPFVPATTVDEATIEVPFSFEKGHLIVHATIKKNVAVEVIVSTGAEHSTMDMALVDKYKLQSGYDADPPVTGHNDHIYYFSIVPDVHVGDAKATNLSMRFASLSEVGKAVGREIFGVLGADYFKGRVVQFDFKKRIMRFLSQSDAARLKDQKSGTRANGPILLRMVENSDPYKNVTLPIVEDVTLDGKKVQVLLDTGAVGVLGLSSSVAKKLGLAVPPEKGTPRSDKIGSLWLGTLELTDVPVFISAKSTALERDLTAHGAVIGVTLLQNFLITFDFRSKIVVLERE